MRASQSAIRGLLAALGLALLLGRAGMAGAQETSIGVRSGVSGAYVVFENEVAGDRSVRAGPLVGGVITHQFGSWAALQVEGRYAPKGWTGAGGEGGRAVAYLEVPVLLRLQRSGALLPHLVLGPTFSHELNCAFTDIPGTGDLDCDDPLVSLDRPTTDVGVLTGVGIGRDLGAGTLWLDVQLNLGLRDIDREPLPRGSQRNVALSLTVAYTVELGREKGGAR